MEMVRQALSLLADPAAGVQLTCMPSWAWGTFPGAGEGIDHAAEWVSSHGDAQGIYYALNPVSVGLETRCKNSDALGRRWLLIDVDRVKTAEDKDFSASAKEHADALGLAEEVREHLHGLGWPDPGFHLDSGNGAHLLYRIDWPNDPESQKVLSAFLKGLAVQFDGPRGELDRAVHDARRISKLPGTWARKGPSTADRPHRMARILSMDAEAVTVPLDLVRQSTPTKSAGEKAEAAPVRVERSPWVLVPVAVEESAELAWARQALASECNRMRSARPGSLNTQLYKSGAAMGNIVASGLLGREEVIEAILEAGAEAGCDNPKKDRATVERGIDEGMKTPRKPEPDPATKNAQPAKQTKQAARDANGPAAAARYRHPVAAEAMARAAGLDSRLVPVTTSLPTVMNSTYPEPRYAVQGIVSEGLNILVGKPKLGKSWLALNLGITIAAGGVALGGVPVATGPVLYLALEDRLRRLQSRSKMVLGGLVMDPPDDLDVSVEWPRLDAGGLDHICEWIEGKGFTGEGDNRAAVAKLVIIDVWAKFRPVEQNSRASAYDTDYAHMAALKGVLDHYGTSALILHHTRKAAAADAMDEVSGTAGIAGAADGVLVLTRTRHQEPQNGEMEAELLVMPRDHEEQKLALAVDQKTWVWTSQGKTSERSEGKLGAAIMKVMEANAGLTISTRTIMDAIQMDPKPSMDSLRKVLSRLVERDVLSRPRDGHYRRPLTETPF